MSDLWVFGYGSLMWRPGFAFEEKVPARMAGVHRALCVYSHVHRGTPERPGLVLGLDRGGSTRGFAFRVRAELREQTLRYLRAREQVTMIYAERFRPARLDCGRSVDALVYLVDRTHVQYAGQLDRDRQLEIVTGAEGQSGPNPAYVIETVKVLEALGMRDATLHWLAERLKAQA